jgi:anti-sigma factor RsiW
MDGHDSLLQAFLGGDLGPDDVRRFDQHLLECEACWRAVRDNRAGRMAAQMLRQPAPPDLADRVAFAVEIAASERPRRRARAPSRLGLRLAGGGTALLAALVVLLVVLLPGVGGTPPMPAAVQAVAHYAQSMTPAAGSARSQAGGRQAAPVEVGQPVSVTVGGQRILMRTWRLGGTEAVVAVSQRPFPMPAGATAGSGGGMAWSARLGKLGMYCVNSRTSELVAAPVPAAELPTLAARLPLT